MSNKITTNGSGSAPPPTIDQVRELLFGNEQRTFETQLAAINEELKAIRLNFDYEVAALSKEMTTKFEQADTANRERFRRTGEAITEVGRSISALSEK